jgi:hypothetical protein
MFSLNVKDQLSIQPNKIENVDDIFNPKFTIGTMDFQFISAPSNFFVLEPTNHFKDLIKDDKICIHMLIGDTHKSTSGQCEEFIDNNDINVINTSSTGWFKILDSISSVEQPIDYFVENYFPFKLLQDPDLILNKNTIQQLKKTELPSLLTFIRDNYLPCFTSDKEIKERYCFTKNIRYHMVDIRTAADKLNVKLTNQQKTKVTIFYERHIYQSFLNFFRSLNSNEIICIQNHAQHTTKVETFILMMLQDNLSECASILFDENNLFFIQKSLIFKQIIKQKGSQTFIMKFCKEYWTFAIKNLFLLHDFVDEKKKIIALIEVRKQFAECINTDFGTANNEQKEYLDHAFKFNKSLKTFLHIVMFPFLDLYYMLRSWKQVPLRSWCSALNAGSMHTFLIASFLSSKKYFHVRFADGKIFEIETSSFDIIKNSMITERCLQVSTPINIDSFVSSTTSFKTIDIRKKFLGDRLYFMILNGHKITHKELEELSDQKQQNIDDMKKLFNYIPDTLN